MHVALYLVNLSEICIYLTYFMQVWIKNIPALSTFVYPPPQIHACHRFAIISALTELQEVCLIVVIICTIQIHVSVNGVEVVSESMTSLRDIWEETSFQLERFQTNPTCVTQERDGLAHRKQPPYKLTFDPEEVMAGVTNGIPNGIGRIYSVYLWYNVKTKS